MSDAWICLHCDQRRIDGDFPDYVCKRAWNGVCEPRVLTPLDPEYEGPYKVKARRLKPVGPGDAARSAEGWERVRELEVQLAQVKAELTASRRLDGLAWRSMRKQRDQALSHLEALAEPPMHLDDVDYPAAVAAARAFLLSIKERDA